VQTGSTAGDIIIRAALQTEDGVDITPCPAPLAAMRIPLGPPVITEVAVVSGTATSFSVAIEGYSVSKAVTSVVLEFLASENADLRTTRVTTDVSALAVGYYGAPESQRFGSQFRLEIPFDVQGPGAELRSVTATLSGPDGASQPMTAAQCRRSYARELCILPRRSSRGTNSRSPGPR
jgi:hypothetical protein